MISAGICNKIYLFNHTATLLYKMQVGENPYCRVCATCYFFGMRHHWDQLLVLINSVLFTFGEMTSTRSCSNVLSEL